MVRASLKGWQYAIDHPEEAVDIVLKYDQTGVQTRAHQMSMMTEIAKLVQVQGRQVGHSDDLWAKPKLAAFWRGDLSFANMIGNLDGVILLFSKGGFAQVVADDSPGVEDSILFDLNHAIEVLRGMDKPFTEVASDDTLRAKLEALRVGLKSAGQTAGDIIARSAGLSLGFNAMDRD